MVARPHAVSLSGALAIAVGFTAFVLIPSRLAAQDCPTCPFFGVSVAPDGTYDPNRSKNSTGHTTTFTVTNTGNQTDTYNFTCSTSGGVTCTNVDPASKTLAGGEQQVVTVTYNVGSSGGQITLDAVGEVVDSGFRLVSTPPTITLTAPRVTNGVDTALVHTRTPLVLATFAADAPIDTNTLVVKLGTDTVTALARRSEGFSLGTLNLTGDMTYVDTHNSGRAVDIGAVNGEDIGTDDVFTHSDSWLVIRLQASLMGMSDAAEVYGPHFAAVRRGGPDAPWSWSPGSLASHQDHVHYSSWLTNWPH